MVTRVGNGDAVKDRPVWCGIPWWVGLLVLWGLGGIASGQRICVLKGGEFTAFAAVVEGFHEVLETGGYDLSGPEFLLDPRNSQKTLDAIESADPQLICTVGNQATQAVLGRSWDIPVVFALVTAPRQFGIVSDPQRGDPRVTGVTADIPLETQLDILQRVRPSARRIGLLYSTATLGQIEDIQKVLDFRGMGMEAQIVRQTDDVVGVLEGMGEIDLFWMLPDRTVFAAQNRGALFSRLRKRQIPILVPTARFLHGKEGGDLAISTDPRACGRQAATMAIDFLERGVWPQVPQAPRTWKVFLKKGRGLLPVPGAVFVE